MSKNVIIVGKGSIGERHARILKELDPAIEIYFFRSQKSNEKNQIWEIQKAVDLNPQFIVICNPASKHFETLNHFWKLGFSCFIEKPIGCFEVDLVNYKNLEVRKEQIIQVGYNLEYHPGLNKLKEFINAGILG